MRRAGTRLLCDERRRDLIDLVVWSPLCRSPLRPMLAVYPGHFAELSQTLPCRCGRGPTRNMGSLPWRSNRKATRSGSIELEHSIRNQLTRGPSVSCPGTLWVLLALRWGFAGLGFAGGAPTVASTVRRPCFPPLDPLTGKLLRAFCHASERFSRRSRGHVRLANYRIAECLSRVKMFESIQD